ncbi:voltage-dependent anion channel-domain-containing protein [Cantharellus anzutake]|uniref:voltage-dependent anion channel-domain-containing protein n=1 Tax=Cantharellus anzutake TaxID=1750568 RepID=UPI0019090512|nr:voltage-dependent anion channel-domain-containing protein [Cantharellus anzutake]KAF8341352.1 voltage-dependent anion channel-domain-containing protein [Cantharellus anzutake]
MNVVPDVIERRIAVLAVPLASEIDAFKHTSIAKRIHAWTWQSFPIGMGTAAVYVCLCNLHHQSHNVRDIARVIYYITIAMFLFNVLALFFQLILYPEHFKKLIFDPVMGVFVPMFCLSLGTIVIGTVNFAVPDGVVSSEFAYRLYWVYIALALIVTFGMTLLWFDEGHKLAEFTPADAFLIFPLMLGGLIGANVLSVLDPKDERALGILFASLFFQGLGFLMAMFFIALYIIKIFLDGLLSGARANAAFVVCGPPGFTAAALIVLGSHARTLLPNFGLISPIAGEVWYAIGLFEGIMLLGLAVFFFIFSSLPYWFKLEKDLHQILGCWALTFPNVGWITAVKLLGDHLHIPGFYIVHDVLTTAMCLTWVVLVVCTSIAFMRHEIFFEQDPLPSKSTAGEASALKAQRLLVRDATQEQEQEEQEENAPASNGKVDLVKKEHGKRGVEPLEGTRRNQFYDLEAGSTETTAHERVTTSLYQRTLVKGGAEPGVRDLK